MNRFHRAATASLTAVVMSLAACSSSQPTPPNAPSAQGTAPIAAVAMDFNDSDVMFLQMMLPHHAQGTQLARLAEQEAKRPEIKSLVAAVEVTQADEAKAMTDWLTQWGKPTAMDPNHSAHAHHGGQPATNAEVIAELTNAKGKDFEGKFLNLFAGHQGAAVEMAQRELKEGSSPQVKELADRLVKSRTGQIQQLLTLLSEQ